jgi:hypothetical protein
MQLTLQFSYHHSGVYTVYTHFSVHQVINRSLGSIIPRNVQKAVLEGLFSLGRAQVSDYIPNEKNPIGSLRLVFSCSSLQRILASSKTLYNQNVPQKQPFLYFFQLS